MRLAAHHQRAVLVAAGKDADPNTADLVAVTDVALPSEGRFGPDPMAVLEDWTAFTR